MNRMLILFLFLSAVFAGVSCSDGSGGDSGTTSDDTGTVSTDTGEDSGNPGDTDSGTETTDGSESVTQGTVDDTGTQSDTNSASETGDSETGTAPPDTDTGSETDSGNDTDSGTGNDTGTDSDSGEMFTFNIGFGGEEAENAFSVLQTPDGGYLVTGYTHSFVNDEVNVSDKDFVISNSDTLLGKFSPRGELEWHKSYGDRFPQKATSIIAAPNGGYLLAGETMMSFGKTILNINGEDVEFPKIRENASLLKVDENGDEVWSEIYGETYTGEGFAKVILTQDNHYLAVGYKVQYDEDYEDEVMMMPSMYNAQMMHYAVKTDLEGTVVWEKEFSAEGNTWNWLTDVVESPTGYMVVGASRNMDKGMDFYVAELSKDSGEVNWEKLHPAETSTTDVDYASAIAAIRDQSEQITGYLIAGVQDRGYSYATKKLSGTIRLLKIDTEGNKVDDWAFDVSGYENPEEEYIKAGIDEGVDIIPTPDGKFALLSVVEYDLFFRSYEECDVYLIKVDEKGQVDWERRYGTAKHYDMPAEVANTADGGFVITGSTQSFLEPGAPLMDAWHLIKTDPQGEI